MQKQTINDVPIENENNKFTPKHVVQYVYNLEQTSWPAFWFFVMVKPIFATLAPHYEPFANGYNKWTLDRSEYETVYKQTANSSKRNVLTLTFFPLCWFFKVITKEICALALGAVRSQQILDHELSGAHDDTQPVCLTPRRPTVCGCARYERYLILADICADLR